MKVYTMQLLVNSFFPLLILIADNYLSSKILEICRSCASLMVGPPDTWGWCCITGPSALASIGVQWPMTRGSRESLMGDVVQPFVLLSLSQIINLLIYYSLIYELNQYINELNGWFHPNDCIWT